MLSIEGNIVHIDGVRRGRVEIDSNTGLISKVGSETGTADLVLKEELIFPGFVDLHVHAREDVSHKQDYKEDFKTAGEAAVNGGVVAFLEMPNNPIPPVDDSSYIAKTELTKISKVEVILYAGIGPNTSPLSSNVPYKLYMGPSVGDLFFTSLKDVETVLEKYKGCSVSFHCEDPKILDDNANAPTHEARRPKEAEISALDFALSMIEKYNLSGKICHASTREAMEKIRNAKSKGLKVVAEVSPHHLFYSIESLNETNRNFMQMNPPLRHLEDKNALITALKEGTIDFIATDHAPHSIEEKIKGTSGTPQLDTYGSVASWLMKEHNFSPEDILRICSYNPGKFFNQFSGSKYGEVKEGFAGSLTILDMQKESKVTKENLKTKCGWSPFEGVVFPGSVTATIIKGRILKNEIN